MGISFRQLEVFRAVAETRSFTRACRTLFVSQSTVSQHVRALEDALKVQLFERNRRNVALTLAGQNLLRYGVQIFELLNQAEAAVHGGQDPYSDKLAFGCASTTLLYQMPPVLMRYAKRYPNVDLTVVGGTIRDVMAHMEGNSLDMALVVLPVNMPEIRKMVLWDENFVVLMSKHHRLARQARIKVEELSNERFILHGRGQNTRRLIDRYLYRHRISHEVPIEIAETETIKAMVAQGLGISVLPVSAFPRDRADRRLKTFPLGEGELKRSLALVHQKLKPLRPPALAMLELLQQHFVRPHGSL